MKSDVELQDLAHCDLLEYIDTSSHKIKWMHLEFIYDEKLLSENCQRKIDVNFLQFFVLCLISLQF